MKYTCRRCYKIYKNWKGLQRHSKVHIKNIGEKEINLLVKGHQPEETKEGDQFKGENKIIIA